VHKTEYWGRIFVGTPAKEFTVIFDTGSGNLILPSSDCQSVACLAHHRYDWRHSAGAARVTRAGHVLAASAIALVGGGSPEAQKDVGATVKFGTGRVHGQFYRDKVCLSAEGACLEASFIGTDTETDEPFQQCRFDGILGLGFKDLSMGRGFNMADDIVAQHSLRSNKFSVYLTDEGGSEITFGGYKRGQAATEPFWVPVSRQSYWQIGIDDVTFDNKKTGLCSNCQVAVDTGTSLLAGPSEVVEGLSAQLQVQEDCSNFDSLPLLGFTIGDKVLNLKPEDYIDRDTDAKSCTLALMTLDVPPPKGPLFIFGDPFLRRFLTIYDRDGPRVGFAVAQHAGLSRQEAATLLAAALPSGVAAADGSEPQAVAGDGGAHQAVRRAPIVEEGSESQAEASALASPGEALRSESLSWKDILGDARSSQASPRGAAAEKEEARRDSSTEEDDLDSDMEDHLKSLSAFRRRWNMPGSAAPGKVAGMLVQTQQGAGGRTAADDGLVSIALVRAKGRRGV